MEHPPDVHDMPFPRAVELLHKFYRERLDERLRMARKRIDEVVFEAQPDPLAWAEVLHEVQAREQNPAQQRKILRYGCLAICQATVQLMSVDVAAMVELLEDDSVQRVPDNQEHTDEGGRDIR